MTTTNASFRVVLQGFAEQISSRKITNEDLAQLMDTSDEWITQRTGIKTRYWALEGETTSDLGAAAARATLHRCGNPKVDAIVAATITPEYFFPGIGVIMQHKLGLEQIPAFDIRNQCAGFIYGLELADSLVRSGRYNRVLLVGAEIQSTFLDLTTRGRDMAVLFGDAAGSCLVERLDDCVSPSKMMYEVLGTELHGDGKYQKELFREHPGAITPITSNLIEEGRFFPYMNGRLVFEHAVRSMVEVSRSLLDKLNLKSSDVRFFVPHQANIRINKMVAKQIGLSETQVISTIENYGNTTSATIPIGMVEMEKKNDLFSGDIILSAAFGSGFTWGASVLKVI